MNPITEIFAELYADGIAQFDHHRRYCIDDFAAGAEYWVKIQRDKDGFATEACLDEMFSNMPFVVYDSRDNDIEAVCQDDWRGDIEKHVYYTYWKPIIKPHKNEDKTHFNGCFDDYVPRIVSAGNARRLAEASRQGMCDPHH